MSFQAVKDNLREIEPAVADQNRSCWHVVGLEINWEDPCLLCAHTNERIPSAYAEDQVPQVRQILDINDVLPR